MNLREMCRNLSVMRRSAMFKQIYTLPSAQNGLSRHYRNRQGNRQKRGFDMGWHIIGTFIGVPQICHRRVVRRRHQPVEKSPQVRLYFGVGIFLNDQRTRSMPHKQRQQPIAFDRVEPVTHIRCELVQPRPLCRNYKLGLHAIVSPASVNERSCATPSIGRRHGHVETRLKPRRKTTALLRNTLGCRKRKLHGCSAPRGLAWTITTLDVNPLLPTGAQCSAGKIRGRAPIPIYIGPSARDHLKDCVAKRYGLIAKPSERCRRRRGQHQRREYRVSHNLFHNHTLSCFEVGIDLVYSEFKQSRFTMNSIRVHLYVNRFQPAAIPDEYPKARHFGRDIKAKIPCFALPFYG